VEGLRGPRDGRLLFACGGRLGSFDLASSSTTWVTAMADDDLGTFNSMVVWSYEDRERVALGGRTRVTVFEAPAT
jgi:hypothetical protein